MTAPYKDYASFLARYFHGKMQKLAVNAGFSCPNRDGTISTGGCSYCCNASFNPPYCRTGLDVTAQLEEGKRFFDRKYPSMRYLAYFQAYTSTHNRSVDSLMEMYREAMKVDGVDGLVIATRPDCISSELLEALKEFPRVIMEYGAESSHDATLEAVNRGHKWSDTVKAVEMTAAHGFPVGLHLIMGLPGENRGMMLQTIDRVNELPVDVVKIHQLQLLRGTRLTARVESGQVHVHRFDVEEYLGLCADIIRRLRPDIAIERFLSQSPPDMLVYPRWGLKNYQFTNLLHNKLNGEKDNMGS